jgi:DNA-binding NarL/FixJ family response regulator
MIRVLICDDQWIVCEGLEAILSADSEIEVVAVAHDGAEALELIPEANPAVALLDLRMPGMDGVQATREIRRRFPAVQVLVLTTYGADEWVFEAIRAGAASP